MRECKSVICTYVFTIVILFLLKKKKKKKDPDPSFGLGKNLKVMPLLSIFSLGNGRETLIPQTLSKTLKYCKVHFPTNPYNALV